MNPAAGEPSLGELLGKLTQETGTLVRQEVQLASTEMSLKVGTAFKDAVLIAIGGGLAIAGLVVLLMGVALGVSMWIPIWVSALAVGGVVFVGGSVAAMSGLASLKRLDATPHKTVETLQQDKAWLKEQLR